MSAEFKWYVAHTYSGYENKVKDSIEKTVENRGLGDLIGDVRIPMEETVEENEQGVKKTVSRKIYPGYVFIKMKMTDESWYVVRNTRGCTGFVGPGSKPVPLSDQEVINLGIEKRTVEVNYKVGDFVNILSGPFDGYSGVVDSIDTEKNIVVVMISMLGRETPVELELNQVEVAE